MHRLRGLLRLAALSAALLSAGGGAAASCPDGPWRTGRVVAIEADGSLRLDDGEVVRLQALLLPREGEADGAMRGRLATLVGREVVVAGKPVALDRWGRNVASIVVGKNLLEGWDVHPARALPGTPGGPDVAMLEELLVLEGLARVWPQHGPADCIQTLLAAETRARALARGLWADPRYAVRRADEPAAITKLAGDFAIVEGTVMSVGDRGARTYLNFGERWTEDMTVTMAKPIWQKMRARGETAASLKGRRVRVRGVVELRGGPVIDIERVEDIEFIEVAGTQ